MMSLAIRADSTSQMGVGHVMRCLALAQTWQECGGQVVFLSHCESMLLRHRIKSEGCHLVPVEKPHPHPDDLENTIDILASICNPHSPVSNWLILDGYHFDSGYQRRIRETGYRLLVIDDMADLSHYYADIIVNQNIYASDLYYQCNPNTTLLLGSHYVLLRREFLKYSNFKRQIPVRAKNVLVTLGGADPDNISLKVIEAVKLLDDADLEIIVVVGPSNPHVKSLQNVMLHASFCMRLLQNVPNMPSLMAWADVAVSAGGSTCWELSFMGLPFVAVILAENQEKIAINLERFGAARNGGWHHLLTEEDFSNLLKDMLYSSSVRSQLARKAKELVDGKGSLRVVNYIDRMLQ